MTRKSLFFFLSNSVSLIILSACVGRASTPFAESSLRLKPVTEGSYYQVQPGETLWRIAHTFGLDVDTISGINRLTDPTRLAAGTELFLPSPQETAQFLWPIRGQLSETKHTRGLSILPLGSRSVRASRSGVVVVAANDLAGWGKTVILNHQDETITVYSGMNEIFVQIRHLVRQGAPIGLTSSKPLYFEIRQKGLTKSSQEILDLLPDLS